MIGLIGYPYLHPALFMACCFPSAGVSDIKTRNMLFISFLYLSNFILPRKLPKNRIINRPPPQQAIRATLHIVQFAVAYFVMLLVMYLLQWLLHYLHHHSGLAWGIRIQPGKHWRVVSVCLEDEVDSTDTISVAQGRKSRSAVGEVAWDGRSCAFGIQVLVCNHAKEELTRYTRTIERF